MEPEINCSELCDSVPGQELDRRPLHPLCRTTITSSYHNSKITPPLSPALLGIVWTFLSCGILLILFFLAFTVRCRNNRIVKMSSPNLNIVTLLGSCLTYSSAYLFGIQDVLVGSSMETVIQTRLSMLCIGTSLVFGPILGKSWRLYKVFTQRVPDKRVIIKDLQLLGLVAALVMADAILLTAWVLTDPIQCLQILGVSMTVRDPIPGKSKSCTGLGSVDTHSHFSSSIHVRSFLQQKTKDSKREESQELWLHECSAPWLQQVLPSRCVFSWASFEMSAHWEGPLWVPVISYIYIPMIQFNL